MSDPFATAGIRQRVLASWAAAPVRFREDANAEEDLSLGGYRDRLVVELAQNAADAAARASLPGRLSLTLHEPMDGPAVLVAANVGEPLSALGVQSLATLRASAKSGPDAAAGVGTVGRFGVGFAAVLAVTDEPAVLSRAGGVRFSRADTAALVDLAGAEHPELAAEVRRRDGHVPVLRLPFEAEGAPPDGFDTAVVLPLRDDGAVQAVRAQLAALDDVLLLGLPALAEVSIVAAGARRVLTDVTERWQVRSRSGAWSAAERAELLADRPTEERRQGGWQVVWAVPRDDAAHPVAALPGALGAGVVHAPTATDEPLSVPALLLASLPLDPTRRHVAGGPLTDRMLQECALGYLDLLQHLAAHGRDVLDLVPVGLAAGWLDGELRERIAALLPSAQLLTAVEDGHLLRGRDAVVLDVDAEPQALRVLAPRVAGLVAGGRRRRAALRALGVDVLPLAEVVDALPREGAPSTWAALYDGLRLLADDPAAREVLAALPVPLADGRVVRGARGLLLPDQADLDAGALRALAPFGLRVVHPLAAHPLLLRLGAVPGSARSVLEDPAVRAAVERAAEPDVLSDLEQLDDDGGLDRSGPLDGPGGSVPSRPRTVPAAVLRLVAAAVAAGELRAGDLPWLAELPLPDRDGELGPAGGLAVEGSFAHRVLDPDEVGTLGAAVADEWPAEVLVAVGVLTDLALVTATEVDLHDPPDELADLAGFEEWADTLRSGDEAVWGLSEVVAILDLDVVLAARWPQVLRHLAADPERRRALVRPGYTGWWVRRELGLVGAVPPGEDDLDGLLDRAPDWAGDLDAEVRQVLGLVEVVDGPLPSRADLLDDGLADRLLDRLTEPARSVSVRSCLRAWQLLAAAASVAVRPRSQVRVLAGAGSRVVPSDAAVVVDDARWLQRGDLGGLVVAPVGGAVDLADLLDVDLASERAPGRVTTAGTVVPVPPEARWMLPAAPSEYVEHDALAVDGVQVDWWVEDDGVVHAATVDGVARGLCFAAGAYGRRDAVATVLAEPARAATALVEDAVSALSPAGSGASGRQ